MTDSIKTVSTSAPKTAADVIAMFRPDLAKATETLTLALPNLTLQVNSNSDALTQNLRQYFAPFLVSTDNAKADLQLHALQHNPQAPDPELAEPFATHFSKLPWVDWIREPGKTNRKDRYINLEDARLIHKVRTGMVFLQHPTQPLAVGPCEANPNQIINFINSQLASRFQQQGSLCCHASAVHYIPPSTAPIQKTAKQNLQQQESSVGMAFAAFSGGGKSTLMLHLLDEPNVHYVSNDRIYIKHLSDTHTLANGIPKMPRVNPGTLLHNSRLKTILPPTRQQELQQLSRESLWTLEEKYDVLIPEHYPDKQICLTTPLRYLVVLNWQHNSAEATQLTPFVLAERQDLLSAIMKSSGAFYQNSQGTFLDGGETLDNNAYLAALSNVTCLEATGQVDFNSLKAQCLELLTS